MRVRADSKLVIEQVDGRVEGEAGRTCGRSTTQARALLDDYEEVDLAHVPREQNTEADALVNAALDR